MESRVVISIAACWVTAIVLALLLHNYHEKNIEIINMMEESQYEIIMTDCTEREQS